MSDRAIQLRSSAHAARQALAGLALCALTALGACRTTLDARGALAPNIDLTQLTLEELLDLEVIPAATACTRPHARDGEGRVS